jgi:outer membrane protein OmpA-like peptidoglycan-associated protein
MALSEDNASLASSLTDLMTSLAVIFILLLVVSLNNAQDKIDTDKRKLEATQRELDEARQKSERTRDEILVALKRALDLFAAQGVKVDADPRDPLALLVLVPEGLLEFALNKADLPQGGLDFLKDFIPKLAVTTCSDEFKKEINAVVVEGHTDSSGTDEINLPLSQRRSMAVAQESLRILGSIEQKPSGLRVCFLDFLSASGRGSVEPIFNQEGNEDRERSRRVVFKIRVRSLEQRQGMLEQIVPLQSRSNP